MPKEIGADIIIVGAGAAGSVLARRLADRAAGLVRLVEAGPDPRGPGAAGIHDGWRLPTIPDWGFTSEPMGAGELGRLRRGRALGGTSWLTRFALRGAAADFDAWQAAGNPGWSFEEVLPAFRRLESDGEFGEQPWHGTGGPLPITRYPDLPRSDIHAAALAAMEAAGFGRVVDHNAPVAIGVGPMPMSARGGRRVTAFEAYLETDGRPDSLAIDTDAAVDVVTLEAGRATGVRLVDGRTLRAGTVILAGGTYGSPTILLRSGIGPAEELAELGIEVAVDLPGVGRGLADHPAVDVDTGWRGKGTTGPILHSIATFHSGVAATDGPPDMMFWLMDPDAADPAFYLDPVLLKPRSRGCLRLRSADPADPPRIALPRLDEAIDIDRLAEGYERALEIAARAEIRSLADEPPPRMPANRAELRGRVIEKAYSLPHVVGTCRMGPSPADGSVVDHLGRVHGIVGLHVIDASIIPDAVAGFPHVVTIMLAEHLADRLSLA